MTSHSMHVLREEFVELVFEALADGMMSGSIVSVSNEEIDD